MEGKHLEYPGVDGRVILKWTYKKGWRDMSWIDLAQDRNRWDSCDFGKEFLGSIKHEKFLD